jgi:hypothetical protein
MKKWLVFAILICLFAFSQNVLAAVTSPTPTYPIVASSGKLACDNLCIMSYRASDASCAYFSCPTGFEYGGGEYGCGWLAMCCCKRSDKFPSVSITHAPETVREGDIVTFTATATDDYNVNWIVIEVDGQFAQNCYVSGTSAPCTFKGGPYKAGSTHTYLAHASDDANQQVNTGPESFTVFYAPVGTCVRAKPTITINPSSQSGYSGKYLVYSISVYNNDNNYCNPSSFRLEYVCPQGWNCLIGTNPIALPPGSMRPDVSLLVWTSPSDLPGKYTFTITAYNTLAAGYFGSGSATYEVIPKPAPTTYGNYIISPLLGSSNSWITLTIKDTYGNIIQDGLTIYGIGSSVDSTAASLHIKLVSITTKSDGTVTDYQLEITAIPTCAAPLDSVTIKCRDESYYCQIDIQLRATNCKGKIITIRENSCQGAIWATAPPISSDIITTFGAGGGITKGNHLFAICLDNILKSSTTISCDPDLLFPCTTTTTLPHGTVTTTFPTTTSTVPPTTITTKIVTTTTTTSKPITTTSTVPPTTITTKIVTTTTTFPASCQSGYTCYGSTSQDCITYCGSDENVAGAYTATGKCNAGGNTACCKCVSTVPAGIFVSFWEFIKAIFGIQ